MRIFIFVGILLMLANIAKADNDWMRQLERSNDRFDNTMMINTQASQVNAMWYSAQPATKQQQVDNKQIEVYKPTQVNERPLYKFGE